MNNIDHETMKYLLNNKVDLFAFMNLSGRFTEDQYFTNEYNEKLKKYYRKNCKLYHPDKLQNASPEEHKEQSFKFSLNSAIYRILSDRELYNEYKKSTELTAKTSMDLKDDYKNSRVEIQRMIAESCKNKSYEDLVKEKESLHGITRDGTVGNNVQFRDKELDMDTFTKMLSNYEADRAKFSTTLQNEHDKKKSLAYDEKKFNEAFENSLLTDIMKEPAKGTAIVPFCETTGTLTMAFDLDKHSYDSLYTPATLENTIDKSFDLLSSHIDRSKQFNDKVDYEEAIKRYQSTTVELGEMVKKSKKEVDATNPEDKGLKILNPENKNKKKQ